MQSRVSFIALAIFAVMYIMTSPVETKKLCRRPHEVYTNCYTTCVPSCEGIKYCRTEPCTKGGCVCAEDYKRATFDVHSACVHRNECYKYQHVTGNS